MDGQCLIVPKSVWREHPFDEELFRDFHLYDVDSCVRIARRYANYICHSVFGEHGSVGSYDDDRYWNVLLFQRMGRLPAADRRADESARGAGDGNFRGL